MNISEHTVKIQTLGGLSLSVSGDPVTLHWPDETMKSLFCSVLSPLDLYYSWDRICRSLFGVAETQATRRQLKQTTIQSLNTLLIRQLGFTPLIHGAEGIRIDRNRVSIDACEFYSTALGGLQQLSRLNRMEACDLFTRAAVLYTGSYLPGMEGKIISNTRKDLESLYRTVLLAAVRAAIPPDDHHDRGVRPDMACKII